MADPTEHCPYCASDELRYVLTPRSPHYAALICGRCRRKLRWLPKPVAERVRRPASHRHLVRRYSRGFCQLCLTAERDLPAGQTLEGHHVVEYQQGGDDSRGNVWIVCTGCARLIHWRRTWSRPCG